MEVPFEITVELCFFPIYAADIGRCSVLAVELWAILYGIRVAWSRGFKEFIVELDLRFRLIC